MKLQNIKQRLTERSIFLAEEDIAGTPAVIGYDKQFRWRWFATQLNTFVVAADFGQEAIAEHEVESFLTASFDYAMKNYRGWPRGIQSAVGVITILISENVEDGSIQYCRELKCGKKWAGFAVPVAVNSRSDETFRFARKPIWGLIYFPYFEELIDALTG